jgi:hypothetical protein
MGMRIFFAALLALHGAIHLASFAKAYGLAELTQLSQAISRTSGLGWLAAGVGFVASAALLVTGGRVWWAPALPALVLSQAMILADFHDAKLGTIVNAIVLVPVALALLDYRPSSLRSQFTTEARQFHTAAATTPAPPITEAELAHLPALVQTYLRRTGAVGRPHVRSFHAVFRVRFRRAPDAGWMDARVDQHDFFAPPAPARLFFMTATQWGIPLVAYHRYLGSGATMRIRVAGLLPIADASGPRMTQGETVTLFNDICVLAPAALIDAPVSWQPLDGRRVMATYTNAGHTISAVLTFDGAGDLVGFVSEDRFQSADGKTYKAFPWSTPISGYRDYGVARLAAEGDARWIEPPPTGEWTYGRFFLERITYNGR